MRLALPLLAVLSLNSCVFVLNGGGVRATADANYQFDATGLEELSVDSYNGRITLVEAEPGATKVLCEVTYYASSSSEEKATQDVQAMSLNGQRDGGKLEIEVPSHPTRGTNNVGATMKIAIPANLIVDLDTSNGSIHIEVPVRQPKIKTANGNVSVTATEGPVDIWTANGRVDLFQAGNASSEVEVRTSNGGIDFEGTSLDFELVTSNGPVHVHLPDGWDGKGYVHTSNGSVTVLSPGTIDAKLSASTSLGSKSVKGPSMEGEGELTIETRNGSISVKHGGSN